MPSSSSSHRLLAGEVAEMVRAAEPRGGAERQHLTRPCTCWAGRAAKVTALCLLSRASCHTALRPRPPLPALAARTPWQAPWTATRAPVTSSGHCQSKAPTAAPNRAHPHQCPHAPASFSTRAETCRVSLGTGTAVSPAAHSRAVLSERHQAPVVPLP